MQLAAPIYFLAHECVAESIQKSDIGSTRILLQSMQMLVPWMRRIGPALSQEDILSWAYRVGFTDAVMASPDLVKSAVILMAELICRNNDMARGNVDVLRSALQNFTFQDSGCFADVPHIPAKLSLAVSNDRIDRAASASSVSAAEVSASVSAAAAVSASVSAVSAHSSAPGTASARMNTQESATAFTFSLQQNPPMLPTGLVYPEACVLHADVLSPNHPERAERVSVTFAQLLRKGILNDPNVCIRVNARLATDEELLRVHTPEHVQCLIDSSLPNFKHRKYLTSSTMSVAHNTWITNPDIYTNVHSNAAARYTVGGLSDVSLNVMGDRLRNAFVVGRPPGHHADRGEPSGFCLINNVAIAIEAVLAAYPNRRIFWFDFDLHHGNAGQEFYYTRRDVLFFSIHKYMNATFFPYKRTAGADHVGAGGAEGFNINVPLNTGNLGDDQYEEIVRMLLLPVMEQFDPDMVFVSAGFDIGLGESLGIEDGPEPGTGEYSNMLVRANGFARMTSLLMKHLQETQGHCRLVVSLEGGYNVENVADGVEAMLRVMMGQPELVPPSAPYTPTLNKAMKKSRAQFDSDLLYVLEHQIPYWPCYQQALHMMSSRVAQRLTQDDLARKMRMAQRRKDSLDAAELDAQKAEHAAKKAKQAAQAARTVAAASHAAWQKTAFEVTDLQDRIQGLRSRVQTGNDNTFHAASQPANSSGAAASSVTNVAAAASATLREASASSSENEFARLAI